MLAIFIIKSISTLKLKFESNDIRNIDNTDANTNKTKATIDFQCKITGKYKQLCLPLNEEANDDLSIYQKKYDCLKDAICQYNEDSDNCQWLQTDISLECTKKYKPKGLRIFKTSEAYKESS